MPTPLQEYIIQQEHAGFSQDQVKQALVQAGYSQDQIKQVFLSLQGGIADEAVHEYVQQYIRQGMTPLQIFKTLTEQGYSPKSVRRSLQDIFGKDALPTHHKVAFLCTALFFVAGTLYLLHHLLAPAPTIHIPPTGDSVSFSPSDQIAQIITIARTKGKNQALQECELRLRNDDRDRCVLDIAILDNVQDISLCNRVADIAIKDACLMNFLEQDQHGVCKQVALRENVQTCQQLASLRATSA